MQLGNPSLKAYLDVIKQGNLRDVLELGTKRSIPDRPTHHKHYIDYPVNYVMTDFQDGLDVDVVCDAHDLLSKFRPASFDAVLSCSTFEHFEKPWIVADQICQVLRPNGVFCVQTHFIFAEHGYPSDYFRYTTEGLKSLFDWGVEVIANYEYGAKIYADIYPDGQPAPSYLNVNIFGRKPAEWE
jgi:SAM-dependent methyltransferase